MGAAERLVELSNDPVEDVRFNSALGLARLGQDDSLEALVEMLALPDLPIADARTVDEAAQSKRYRRALIVVNAVRGVALLVDATNQSLPSHVRARVEALQQDPVADVRSSAAALIKKMDRLKVDPTVQ